MAERKAPAIRVEGLWKTYHLGGTTVNALAGVDAEIAPGAFGIIMGPSGSGKSTLLYLIGGLDRSTRGMIEVDGERIDQMDENHLAIYRHRTVGFVFQSFNLIASMSALENVAYPLRFSNVPARQRRERALHLLDRVGLANRAHHKPTELSGGQQQRVAVARALINDPRLILADEPTGNLDTSSGAAVLRLLEDLHGEGRSVLVVTHDPRVRAFSTQLLHILDGRIVDEATYLAAGMVEA